MTPARGLKNAKPFWPHIPTMAVIASPLPQEYLKMMFASISFWARGPSSGEAVPTSARAGSFAMDVHSWDCRKRVLEQELAFCHGDLSPDPALLAIRLTYVGCEEVHGVILDLGLPDRIQSGNRRRRPEVTCKRVVLSEPPDINLMQGQDYMLVGANLEPVQGPMPSRLHWPTLSSSTGHVKLTTANGTISEVAEFFAGGLNAWTVAARHLPVHVTMRVDCKELAVHMMKINLEPREDSKPEVSLPVEGSVADMQVLSRLDQEEGLLMSPPCQPFSSMGKGKGLNAFVATSWDALFRALRITQRRFAVLENVCGLLRHEDFQEIIRTMGFCGFVLVAQRTCDAVSLGCAARPRVLLVFWNSADCQGISAAGLQVPTASSLGPPIPCCRAGSVWHDMPDRLVRDLLITTQDQALLSRRDLLSPWLRQTRKDVWKVRMVNEQAPFPSITAAYHKSTSLPEHHLRDKGLHVPLVGVGGEYRRLSKWEILHSLGMPLSITLPADEEAAVSIICESFPPAHAFEAMLLALSIHPHKQMTQQQVDSLFLEGVWQLAPSKVDWSLLEQVEYQGWARLTCKGMEFHESCNLAAAVQKLWKDEHRQALYFPGPCTPIMSQPDEREKSFFHVEDMADHVTCRVLRPGWPPRQIVLQNPDDWEEPYVQRALANMWSLDKKLTVVARAQHLRGQPTFLVDEVISTNIYKRLVFVDGLMGEARWLHCRVEQCLMDAAPAQHSTAQVNGVEACSIDDLRLQDGDVVRFCHTGSTDAQISVQVNGMEQLSHDDTCMHDDDVFKLCLRRRDTQTMPKPLPVDPGFKLEPANYDAEDISSDAKGAHPVGRGLRPELPNATDQVTELNGQVPMHGTHPAGHGLRPELHDPVAAVTTCKGDGIQSGGRGLWPEQTSSTPQVAVFEAQATGPDDHLDRAHPVGRGLRPELSSITAQAPVSNDQCPESVLSLDGARPVGHGFRPELSNFTAKLPARTAASLKNEVPDRIGLSQSLPLITQPYSLRRTCANHDLSPRFAVTEVDNLGFASQLPSKDYLLGELNHAPHCTHPALRRNDEPQPVDVPGRHSSTRPPAPNCSIHSPAVTSLCSSDSKSEDEWERTHPISLGFGHESTASLGCIALSLGNPKHDLEEDKLSQHDLGFGSRHSVHGSTATGATSSVDRKRPWSSVFQESMHGRALKQPGSHLGLGYSQQVGRIPHDTDRPVFGPCDKTSPELNTTRRQVGSSTDRSLGFGHESGRPLAVSKCTADEAVTVCACNERGDGIGLCDYDHDESKGPLNPRLLWPRYEPSLVDPIGLQSDVPGHAPTQRFLLRLPSGEERHSHEMDSVGLDAETVSVQEVEKATGVPPREQATGVPPRRYWTEGGLKGGARVGSSYDCATIGAVKGWWLCVLGKGCLEIPVHEVQGRTIRQEREGLGLMGIDPTQTMVLVMSSKGMISVKWDYKFPLTAKDGVVVILAPKGVDTYQAIQEASRLLPRLCIAPLNSQSYVTSASTPLQTSVMDRAHPVDPGFGSELSTTSVLSHAPSTSVNTTYASPFSVLGGVDRAHPVDPGFMSELSAISVPPCASLASVSIMYVSQLSAFRGVDKQQAAQEARCQSSQPVSALSHSQNIATFVQTPRQASTVDRAHPVDHGIRSELSTPCLSQPSTALSCRSCRQARAEPLCLCDQGRPASAITDKVSHLGQQTGVVSTHLVVQASAASPQESQAKMREPCSQTAVTVREETKGTVFFVFINVWRCVDRRPEMTVAQVLEDEWGVLPTQCIVTVNGRQVSAQTLIASVPKGMPVRVTTRLKGGGQSQIKKLRELLISKGVAAEDVQSRAMEVVSAIGGEAVLSDIFNSFDSWQLLKAKCQGKLRIIKQAEVKPNRPKKQDEEEDFLQTQDPWAEALQQRQIRPDVSFFKTASGAHPCLLQSVSHGCTGLAVVDVAEANVLAKAKEDMSPDELAVIVLGDKPVQDAQRPSRSIEFPCLDSKGCRLLARGILIDLGSARMGVVGEESKFAMDVMSSSCIACEVHRNELEDWQEFVTSPVRFLKKMLCISGSDLLHTWGRKAYRQNKLTPSLDSADSMFIMLRVKAACTEAILRLTVPGLYTSPRLESGEPDWSFKVVWCPEKSLSELRIIAPSTQGCLGIVKSRSGVGVRCKCTDYSSVRKKLYPDWVPQDNTPYNCSLPEKYELHHVHPGAGKEELQKLLNTWPWQALVIKQSRPKVWIVSAACPPPRDTILTQHGCILVLPSGAAPDRGSNKGKGKGKRTKSPSWILGSHQMANASDKGSEPSTPAQRAPAQGDIHGPIKKAVLEVEQKMEERFALMREEATASHALLKQDLMDMKSGFQQHVEDQKQVAKDLSDRVNNVESSLASQLGAFMTTLNATISQQNQELTGRIVEGQQTLRTELSQELRSQIGNFRKRTPPPSEGEAEGDKRPRE